jgi:hypothetical protein
LLAAIKLRADDACWGSPVSGPKAARQELLATPASAAVVSAAVYQLLELIHVAMYSYLHNRLDVEVPNYYANLKDEPLFVFTFGVIESRIHMLAISIQEYRNSTPVEEVNRFCNNTIDTSPESPCQLCAASKIANISFSAFPPAC